MEPAREMIRYQAWATTRLLDHCLTAPGPALALHVPWTLGTIPTIFDHMLVSEWWGLNQLGVAPPARPKATLLQLREQVRAFEEAWLAIVERLEDHEFTLPARPGAHPDIRNAATMLLLQAWHHGEVHRTEIRAALSAAGSPYPGRDETDVWAFWMERG